MDEILARLGRYGVIPVATVEKQENAAGLAAALVEAELPVVEITLRTRIAGEAIRHITKLYPEMVVGAGTVLSSDQAELAKASGAQFIVSPSFDVRVVSWCRENDLPVVPGVATPTEIQRALSMGLTVLKFFPAAVLGGPAGLVAIAAPYPDARFVPTGGIDADNLADYLRLPMVLACGGTWLARPELLATQNFKSITDLARDALATARAIRG